MKLFSILEIDNKTDVLAFAAFLISLVSITYALTSFLQGSSLRLLQPESLIVVASKYDNGDDRYIANVAPFSYTNTGGKDYSSVVTREALSFEIGTKERSQTWLAFVSTTTESEAFSLSSKLKPIFRHDAAPFVVSGGSGKAHETYLASERIPCQDHEECDPNRNYVLLKEFLKQFAGLHELDGPKNMPFTVVLETQSVGEGPFRGRKTHRKTCTVLVGQQDIIDLKNESKSYFSLPCIEREPT